jgi:hypothetical protein
MTEVSCVNCKYNHSPNRYNRRHGSVYCSVAELQICPQREYFHWEEREDDFIKEEEFEI